MSLLYANGFDGLGGLNSDQLIEWCRADGWYGTWYVAGTQVGPFGGLGFRMIAGDPSSVEPLQNIPFNDPVETGYVVLGMRRQYNTGGRIPRVLLFNYDVQTVQVYEDAFGTIVATFNGVTARSKPGIVTAGAFYWLEIKYWVLTGQLEVKVNGVVRISVSSSTVDFLPKITGWGMFIPGIRSSSLSYMDDVYALDSSGDTCNDYLGNIRVRFHGVIANGDNINFTPVNAASNYLAVQSALLSKTSYVQGDTVGQYDLYQLAAGSDARTIFGIVTRISVRQADATQLWTTSIIKTGGVEFESSPLETQSSFRLQKRFFEVNPNTGLGWENGEINTLQMGGKLSASE